MISNYNELDSKSDIIEEYFRLYDYYSKQYGLSTTILFVQVGAFFEAYQTLDRGFNLKKISDMLNIIVSKKNKSIIDVTIKNPYLLGFPVPALDKYLKILLDNNYTVVICEQTTPPPYPKRVVTNIFSPGTYLNEISPDSNNILSIYIEEIAVKNKTSNIIIGLSILDLTTGKSCVHEIYSTSSDEKLCLDETIHFMYSNQAKEIIVTTNNIKEEKIKDIITYLELSDKLYYYQTIEQLYNTGKKSLLKLSYQQELLKKVFPDTGLLTPIEFLDLDKLMYGRLSFIILLNYAYDHSHNIINNIDKPDLYNNLKYLQLGNNAIFQLNLLMYDKDNLTGIYDNSTQYKSLFDVLNKTSTAMGRRMLKFNLAQPLINAHKIKTRYTFINKLLEKNYYDEIEKKLIGISDIEKLNRKIKLNIIHPLDFFNYIESLSNCAELFNYMLLNNLLLNDYNLSDILIKLNDFLSLVAKYFNINELQKYLINDMSGCIFNKGFFKDIDILCNSIIRCSNYMDALSWGLSNYLDDFLKIKKSEDTKNTIKVDCNERDGHFLILTKRRAEILEDLLNRKGFIKFNYGGTDYIVKKEELQFKHLPKGNNSKIFIEEMKENSKTLLEYQDELKLKQKEHYVKILSFISNKYGSLFEIIYTLTATVDFLKSGAKISVKYHYSIPVIEENKNSFDKSFFKATQLRHPIIELINTETLYVPSDVELGTEKQDGILLFGLNSSGKSSLQKSIGIAIIMAQIGYPVAAKKFIYYPYNYLFTRISSNDNIFKKLSSFALEMSEIRSIIKRSNKNTLVIADEVCKGTEHKSSLIIVQTLLEILSQRQTSFITATHLHEITKINRLQNLKNIKTYHMHVEYNEKQNTIIYDRILREGNGESFYGLNVAKYLLADETFMNLANTIKKEVFEIPDLIEDKISNYNNDVYMDKCNICNHQPKKQEIPLETHHIVFQKDFTNNINQNKLNVKKNYKHNLVVLCQKCHDLIDSNKIVINGWIDSNKHDKLDWKYI